MEPNPALEALSSELGILKSRVRRLEDALQRAGIAADKEPGPTVAFTPEPALREVRQASLPPMYQPPMAPPPTMPYPVVFAVGQPEKPGRSLENRIGSHLFNRVGVVAVLIAAAWFLKLAIDNHWIGALGRVTIGLLSGMAVSFVYQRDWLHLRGNGEVAP